jgi:type III secretion protein R
MPSIDPISLALMLGAISLLPLVLICTTCFLKVSVVLVIVRNAIGVQQVPPSMAVYGIALATTLMVMAPVFKQVYDIGHGSYQNAGEAQRILPLKDLQAAAEPIREFMIRCTSREQRERMKAVAARQWPEPMAQELQDSDYVVLIPAFVVSELQAAFEAGFILYVPFVVIDLLISNLLLALGMQMVSPMTISLPLKLLLFVLLDGWARLIEGLAKSYL